MNFYCVEADPEDWGLVAILPSLHICLTLQRSLTSHPRQAFGTDSKCPDVLLTAPLFHIPFGKQHDNYSGMHFCEPFRGFVFRLKEGGLPPHNPSRCATTDSRGEMLLHPCSRRRGEHGGGRHVCVATKSTRHESNPTS